MGMKKDGVCPECGGKDIMVGVAIKDATDSAFTETLHTFVDGKPDAIIFTDRCYSEMQACVCGRCRHVELYVDNPAGLWDAYQAARNQHRR